MGPTLGIEPRFLDYEARVIPLYYIGAKMEPRTGIEPALYSLQGSCLANRPPWLSLFL